ncbi:MAG: hypothetical protein US54_C0060G0006 [Candidatus Roizmanbacteria bacterium GW2011_GWA2_37_7]|uniref:Uncharacterized protein n=1 Tax=Candidatus Roizmanbacteria bacterium GW2011_GWA2_37_7 TaxID=1618481 RepID=A0A0G0HDQ8_9BACT|nr:MAG: hypothetical protein US54_C0060G0006 [Candidatus Roizmanbacteria bacterium GW2011_GWA2_37_7]
MLNTNLIQNKIDYIQKDLAQLASYKNMSYDIFMNDYIAKFLRKENPASQ